MSIFQFLSFLFLTNLKQRARARSFSDDIPSFQISLLLPIQILFEKILIHSLSQNLINQSNRNKFPTNGNTFQLPSSSPSLQKFETKTRYARTRSRFPRRYGTAACTIFVRDLQLKGTVARLLDCGHGVTKYHGSGIDVYQAFQLATVIRSRPFKCRSHRVCNFHVRFLLFLLLAFPSIALSSSFERSERNDREYMHASCTCSCIYA